MKKKVFYGFSFFVCLFLLAAWQIAAAELAEIESEKQDFSRKQHSSELALLRR